MLHFGAAVHALFTKWWLDYVVLDALLVVEVPAYESDGLHSRRDLYHLLRVACRHGTAAMFRMLGQQ